MSPPAVSVLGLEIYGCLKSSYKHILKILKFVLVNGHFWAISYFDYPWVSKTINRVLSGAGHVRVRGMAVMEIF